MSAGNGFSLAKLAMWTLPSDIGKGEIGREKKKSGFASTFAWLLWSWGTVAGKELIRNQSKSNLIFVLTFVPVGEQHAPDHHDLKRSYGETINVLLWLLMDGRTADRNTRSAKLGPTTTLLTSHVCGGDGKERREKENYDMMIHFAQYRNPAKKSETEPDIINRCRELYRSVAIRSTHCLYTSSLSLSPPFTPSCPSLYSTLHRLMAQRYRSCGWLNL